ncbi:hypothetical protein NMG60_11032921 [Bertholletia excelsa]
MRRDQVHSVDSPQYSPSRELELETFQTQVADRFHDLSSVGQDDLLSLPWIRKLLDVFLCCQEDFRSVLFKSRGLVNKSPLDRLISEYFERSVKALDVCNAMRDGIEQIRRWEKQLEIVLITVIST